MTNLQCAETWKAQKRLTGKGSNLFFREKIIYSYGEHFPIAKIITPKIIFFTSKSYSSSTAKHKSIVFGVLPYAAKIFYVPHVCINDTPIDAVIAAHKENFMYLLNTAIELRALALRARIHGEEYKRKAYAEKQMLCDYLGIFETFLTDEAKTWKAFLNVDLFDEFAQSIITAYSVTQRMTLTNAPDSATT